MTPEHPGETLLKDDLFGRILSVRRGGLHIVRREYGGAKLALPARMLAANEAASLKRLDGMDAVPQLLDHQRGALERSFIDGAPMQVARPVDPAYFHQARRLLQRIHRRGVCHNDLAKEPNWLVRGDGSPAVVDFQIALRGDPRSGWMRLLAREDLRHLLKHKRTYCPGRVTPVERRLLKRPSWLRRTWFALGKPVYRFVTRRLLGWRDNEGRHGPFQP